MDQEKLKKLQKQYNDEDYQDDDGSDELLQENSDMYDQDAYEVTRQPKGKSNKLSGVITQVQKGSSQPNVQQEQDIPNEFFVQNEIVIGPQRECDKGKKTLALDLDETLVHSSFEPVDDADLLLPVEIEGTIHKVYVLKRPGVNDFLKRLHKHYELIIYTASLSKYADPLLDWLDPKNYCGYRLFREHCSYVNGIFVKDLSRLDRPLSGTMIIDNSPTSYLFHPECAIPTVSWYSDRNDKELYQLCSILEKIAYVDDVRPYLQKFIKNNKVNFERAAKVLSTIKPQERPTSKSPSKSPNHRDTSPSLNEGPMKAQQAYTKDDRQAKPNSLNQPQDYKTTDDRNKVANNIMMNTWMANKNTNDDQYRKYNVPNQYKNMGLHSMNSDMQRLLSNTLNSQINVGRNYADREHKRSTSKKHSRTAANSSHGKRSSSKRRKSMFRGRNDNSFGYKTNSKYEDANTMFLNMIKNSLKPKNKHRKNEISMNVSKGRDGTISSIMPKTVSHIGRNSAKRSRSKHPRNSSSPKRVTIKYSKNLGRGKGVSMSTKASPKSKKTKVSMDYNSNGTNSFKFNNMMKEMGMIQNYNKYPPQRHGIRSRQGVIGSKKSSMIDSMIGNANKARERAQKMYSATNIHTPTPSNEGLLFNDSSKRGNDIMMMGANNNHHQHIYKLTSTGRGKTPHQKPGSVKRRKASGSNKRSQSRPRSSKNSGAGKQNAFQPKFFDPKLMLNSYNM